MKDAILRKMHTRQCVDRVLDRESRESVFKSNVKNCEEGVTEMENVHVQCFY